MEEPVTSHFHSKEKDKKSLEEGFLKPDEELPSFEEHELDLKHGEEHKEEIRTHSKKTEGMKAKELETERFTAEKLTAEKTKSKEIVIGHKQLPHEVVHKVIRVTCLVALVIWVVLIAFLSIITNSDPFATLVGLSPVLLTIIVTYILVDKYHVESGFLMVFPLIFSGVLFMLGLGNVLGGIDYRPLTSVNIVFGLLFEIAIITHYSILRRKRKIKIKHVKEKKKEKKKLEEKLVIKLDNEEGLKAFVSSIEDKSKAINAAIGRVYSVRHGGTEPLRKKIKIDATHYNEFSELKNEEPDLRKGTAVALLKKIKERLEVLQRPEKEVLDNDDMASLLNLKRNFNGKDKVIDVLVNNDKDPVKAYYDGALEFCNDALKQLGI